MILVKPGGGLGLSTSSTIYQTLGLLLVSCNYFTIYEMGQMSFIFLELWESFP
jgi:hypothetical protein